MLDQIETVEDGVAILTLNRPENLNALSDEICLGPLEAFHRLGALVHGWAPTRLAAAWIFGKDALRHSSSL
jgi:hypothetical protein